MSKTNICISLMLCIAQQALVQSKQKQHLFTFLQSISCCCNCSTAKVIQVMVAESLFYVSKSFQHTMDLYFSHNGTDAPQYIWQGGH